MKLGGEIKVSARHTVLVADVIFRGAMAFPLNGWIRPSDGDVSMISNESKLCPRPSRGRSVGIHPLLVVFKSRIIPPHARDAAWVLCGAPPNRWLFTNTQIHVLKISAAGYTLSPFP